MTIFPESAFMGLTVNKTIMTTEEIKLLLAATEKRIAELEPQKKELYSKFQELEKQVEELSKPMKAAGGAWHLVYCEVENLKVTKTRYLTELLDRKEEVAA